MDTEKEIKDFLLKLKEQRTDDRNQCRFLSNHNFHIEAKYYQERIKFIDVIESQLEMVLGGHTRGIDVEFKFY